MARDVRVEALELVHEARALLVEKSKRRVLVLPLGNGDCGGVGGCVHEVRGRAGARVSRRRAAVWGSGSAVVSVARHSPVASCRICRFRSNYIRVGVCG